MSPTTAAHVVADLDGKIDWILDGGPSAHGLESTIVACLADRPALLRPGAITREAIESVLGSPIDKASASRAAPSAPGQLASHYAPNAELRLGAADAAVDEAALDFGGSLSLSPAKARLDFRSGDLIEAASHLFSYLRALDAAGATRSPWRRSPNMDLGRRSTIGSAGPRRRGRAEMPRGQFREMSRHQDGSGAILHGSRRGLAGLHA